MKISVALCTYNGENFLELQLNSILEQTLKVDEIVVCDDGSSDKTIEILNSYAEKFPDIFKIHINEINLKSLKNFEKAIKLCTGDIIFLSDQDDIWIKEKVNFYYNYFNNNPKIDVLASNGYCIDSLGKVHEKYAVWDVPFFLKEKNISFNYFDLITITGNIATGASMAIRKKIVPDILPFPLIKGFHHDEWIAILASQKNTFELINEKLFYYRIHQNQQVGGVFYKKTKKTKTYLTYLFSNNELSINTSYKNYKRKLKKLCISYKKCNKIIEKCKKNDIKKFEENLIKIENIYTKTKRNMIKQYPIRAFLLFIFDKILNKRQL